MSLLLLGAETLAAATLILSVTRGVAARMRVAGLRHLVRLGGLVALLLLPLAAFCPSLFVLPLASPPTAVAAAATPQASALGWWLLSALACLWLTGALALLVRGFSGAFALSMLLRRSKPHNFDTATLATWTAQAGLGDDWRLRLSAEIETPISWGIVRPIVLLPEQCADWSAPQRDAAMLHELAHLHRRDGLAQAIALFCCALYWPHPLVWMEATALRADAECAADDAVIVSGVKQSDYADLLLRVAAGVSEPHAFAGLEFSMAGRSGLEARIQSILVPNPSRSGVTKMQIRKTVLFGTAAALVFALARPSFAEMQPAQTQPAAAPTSNALPRPVTQSDLPPEPAAKTVKAKPAAQTGNTRRMRLRTDAPSPADTAHIGEAVAKAIDAAHLDEIIAKAVNDAHIDEAVARATNDAQIGEKVAAALAEAHIDEKVAAAMKAAQPKIEAAVARAQRALETMPAVHAAPAVKPVPATPPVPAAPVPLQ